MKTRISLLIVMFVIAMSANSFAQERNYKNGSAWSLSFITTNAGQGVEYLNSLKTTWKAVQDEAVKQGLILSYKILTGSASSPDDWNLLLMIEYKNLAGMEGNEDKWEAIQAKVVGNQEDRKKLQEIRASQRTMYGQRLMREVVYK